MSRAHAPSHARPRRESVTSMGKKGVSRPPTARPSQRGKTNSAAFGAVPLRAVLAVALAAVVVALYRSRTPPPTPASVAGFADKVADALNSSASVAAARRDQQRVDFWRERLGASRGPYVPPAGCKDLYPKECAAYAQNNECVKNPGWMIVHCAVTCRSCDIRRPEVRCDRRFLNVSALGTGPDPLRERLRPDGSGAFGLDEAQAQQSFWPSPLRALQKFRDFITETRSHVIWQEIIEF